MIGSVTGKIRGACQRLRAKRYFGFASGHSTLTDRQVLAVKEILLQGGHEVLVEEYDRRFAALIGHGYGKSIAAGRMAFYVLLKAMGIGPGDEVILPGFTCAVMPNAIRRCGATPVFSDIAPDTLGSDAAAIAARITTKTRVIVAQHSFGIPCRIEEIVALARERSIPLIEDSAIALGSKRDGVSVGNWGDAAIFSTDHTKPLNTLVGGFLYTRDRKLYDKVQELTEGLPGLAAEHQHRLFDRFIFERTHYIPGRYGRAFLLERWHAWTGQRGKGSVFFESDYDRDAVERQDYPYPASMPAFLAQIGLFELERWPAEAERRKTLLRTYLELIDRSGLQVSVPAAYRDPRNSIVPLRFVFCSPAVERMRQALGAFLDVRQAWFQEPVICCPNGPERFGYRWGDCPRAEEAGRTIINWPCVVPDSDESILVGLLREACRRVAGSV